ncbi:MAG: c-type cytochrome [Pseudomonadota bacterium]
MVLKISHSAVVFFLLFNMAIAAGPPPLTDEEADAAAANYKRYCALCHGEDRQGHVNDHAPSLRSKSLMTSGEREVRYATEYGRFGTPMAGYLDEVGGPMSKEEIRSLVLWLRGQVAVEPYTFTYEAIPGDTEVGREVYAEHCASCHGESGEGGTGTALGNPAMLSLTTDAFLKYAIEHGRDGTDMPAFGEALSAEEINGVTAFLRSRATGWTVKRPILRSPPTADNYVLNPDSPHADLELKDGLYVMSADLLKVLQEEKRIVLLDTRAMSQWLMVNIEGSVPLPYYMHLGGLKDFVEDLPNDGTMIVTYCECPRAAAEYVSQKIRELGFTRTAVLWEGIRGWVSFGYPVFRGETTGAASTVGSEAAQRDDRDAR